MLLIINRAGKARIEVPTSNKGFGVVSSHGEKTRENLGDQGGREGGKEQAHPLLGTHTCGASIVSRMRAKPS